MDPKALLEEMALAWSEFEEVQAILDGFSTAISMGLDMMTQRNGLDEEPELDKAQAEAWAADWERFKVGRRVDAFLACVRDLMLAYGRWEPRALLSDSWTVEVKRVIESDDLNGLKRELVEQKVSSLTRGGYAEMRTFLSRRLRLDIGIERSDEDLINHAIAIRNAVVHNWGHVDRQFLKDARGYGLEVGAKVPIEDGEELAKSLYRGTYAIYKAFAAKAGRPNASPFWFWDDDIQPEETGLGE